MDRKKHGLGNYTSSNGTKYTGEHKDDERSGYGPFIFANNSKWAGHKYVGALNNSCFEGQGTYNYPEGKKDIGEWKDSKFYSVGIFIWK